MGRTVFLLNQIPGPRLMKRVEALSSVGEVHLVAINRSGVNLCKVDDAAFDSCHIVNMDVPSASDVRRRLAATHSFSRFAKQAIRNIKPTCIYVGGLDCLSIAAGLKDELGIRCLVYEVADIREILLEPQKGIKALEQAALRAAEVHYGKLVDILVVTSQRFYSDCYQKAMPGAKVIFAPNAPDPDVFSQYRKQPHEGFIVGFIGALRYPDQMKLLIEASTKAKVDLLFAGGYASKEINDEVRGFSAAYGARAEFTGPYVYDRDIVGLYQSIDCVYSVYDADNPNVRIALPNKLYEAIICELPIIVAKGTYLADIVDELGCGVSVSCKDTDELAETIARLKNDTAYYDRLVEGCRKAKADESWNLWRGELIEACCGKSHEDARERMGR